EVSFAEAFGGGGGARGALLERGAAEEDLHARQQLAHRERLAEVVVRTDLESEDAVELLVARGEKDDGDALGLRADAAAELEAVHLRHEDVEDHQTGQLVLECVPRFEAVRVELDRIALDRKSTRLNSS